MTYIVIDTRKKEGKTFLNYAKTLDFVEVYDEPNAVTKSAIYDIEKGLTTKHKNAKTMFEFLNKKANV